jgi:hypothetical protein
VPAAAPPAPVSVPARPERAPSVRVTIGRVEVRAPAPPPAAPAARPPAFSPRLSLEDYLRERSR